MQYSFENEFLKVTVDAHAAELVSVINKETGAEMMWCADPAVWGRHAPVLFPYCGKVRGGQYELDGQTYQGGQHGFARDFDHEYLGVEGNTMRFVLESNAETLAKYPRDFRLESIYSLEGRRLRHTIRVTNTGDKEMRFGLGFHPGFAFPFDDRHTTADYELRFDKPQTPIVQENQLTGPNAGFVNGKTHAIVENSSVIPLDDRMFDDDSMAMSQMDAKTLAIVEKDSGRKITVGIEGFPYVLLWSAGGQETLRFLCIEPWHTLQDTVDSTGKWNDKSCAAQLAPGEVWHTDLDMTFDR